MRILLLESHPGVGAATAAELLAHGHDIAYCHEPGKPAFPCTEIERPGSCPLRGTDAVEVAVVVHDPAADSPTMAESGVACAIRAHVPVVSRHEGPTGPFTGWTFPAGAQPVADACEVAALLSRATEAHPLVTEVRRLLAAAGDPTDPVHADIERKGDRTRIMITVPEGVELAPAAIATRVHACFEPQHDRDRDVVVDVGVRLHR